MVTKSFSIPVVGDGAMKPPLSLIVHSPMRVEVVISVATPAVALGMLDRDVRFALPTSTLIK